MSSNLKSKLKKKKLSPDEEAALKQKRAKFREIYEWFAFLTAADAETETQITLSELEGLFMRQQDKIKVYELGTVASADMRKQKLLEILHDLPVSEASGYVQAVQNAIRHHIRERNKEVKVSELGIKLLD